MSRPGAGEAGRRETPSGRAWRGVTTAALAVVALVLAWAYGPDGFVARTATLDPTPIATVSAVGGRVRARLAAGRRWAPLLPGDVLLAGADLRTTTAGAATLVTTGGVELHLEAGSRLATPGARTVTLEYGSLRVDARGRLHTDRGPDLDIASRGARFDDAGGLYTLRRVPRGTEIRVLDGRVLVKGGHAVVAGECRLATAAGSRDDRASLMPCR